MDPFPTPEASYYYHDAKESANNSALQPDATPILFDSTPEISSIISKATDSKILDMPGVIIGAQGEIGQNIGTDVT